MSGGAAQLAAAPDIRQTSIRSFVFMKRISALGASLLVFTACTQAALPSEEVFSRAMTAIRDFSSATFTFHAKAEEGGAAQWKADAVGQMASGGRQLRFDIDATMANDVRFEGGIVIPEQNEVYVKADTISMGDSVAPMMGAMTGQWWKLPSGTGASASAVPMTPDPSLLSMQLEIMTIAKDHGIQRINQRKAYKYDVIMDETKLMNYLQTVDQERGREFNRQEWQSYFDSHDIAGTIWIDAEIFLPDRIEWTVKSTPTANPETTLTLDVTFADHNKETLIAPPDSFANFPVTVDALQNLFAPAMGAGSDLPLP